MEKEHIAIYLPSFDGCEDRHGGVPSELRSRANRTRWLLEQALRDREPAGRADGGELMTDRSVRVSGGFGTDYPNMSASLRAKIAAPDAQDAAAAERAERAHRPVGVGA